MPTMTAMRFAAKRNMFETGRRVAQQCLINIVSFKQFESNNSTIKRSPKLIQRDWI